MIYKIKRFSDSPSRPNILDLKQVERKLYESGLSKREVDIIIDGLRGCDEPEKIMKWVKTGKVEDPKILEIMKKTGLSFPAAYIESEERTYSFNSEMPEEIKIDNLDLKKTKPLKFISFLGRHIKSLGESQEKYLGYDFYLGTKNIGGICLNLDSPGIVDLSEIVIKPNYRGNHYATKIITWFIDYFQKHGYKKITLDAAEGSPDAVHIYEKLGFKKVKVVSKDDIWGGLTNMELIL